jgi:UDP-3-O-[3-hydroxymyristoyl] N-acetylglucosamine deacetylase / 3-hydroxyacyl-[acyl-carrier-protein] dehydratase
VEQQQTIKKEVSLSGIGIHTGRKINCVFKPAPAQSGINFVRVDLPEKPIIPAQIYSVTDFAKRPRRTSIGVNDSEVHTVEHLLASLVGLKIDNITIEIDGEELPGLDGSALEFLRILKKAGLYAQDAPRKFYTVREPIFIQEKDASIVVLPSDHFRVSYTLSYDHPMMRSQFGSFALNDGVFEKQIAPARTFCTENEGKQLRQKGLGKGADYNNTLVVGDDGVIENTLRFPDEFVRHKILDLIGDFALLGMHLKGHVIAIKSGHPLNISLVQKLKRQEERSRAAGVPSQPNRPMVGGELDTTAIQRIIPHRHPFLFVDRVLELDPGKRAVAIKNVSASESFFSGHFPGHPVMPGVLIVEAMAQVCGILSLSRKENAGKLAYFMSIEKAKFRRTVLPGDQLVLEVHVKKLKTRTVHARGEAKVNGRIVAESEFMFSLVEA